VRRSVKVFLLFLLVAVGGLAAACGSSSSSVTSSPPGGSSSLSGVTIRVGVQGKANEVMLQKSGEASNLPYKITYALFNDGPTAFAALKSGAIDLAGGAETPTAVAYAAGGLNAQIVSASETLGNTSLVLVPKGSPIKSVTDLKGKTIGVTKSTGSHAFLLEALAKAGLRPSDVHFAYLSAPNGQAAFSTGQIAAWDTWYPFASAAEGRGARILVTSQGIYQAVGFQLASDQALANPRTRAALADYLKRSAKASAWAIAHRAEWAPIFSSVTGLPASLTLVTLENSSSVTVSVASVLADAQRTVDTLAQNGVLSTPVNLKNHVSPYAATEFAAPPVK
jgi:sulfonate transport system substrate-binding protein